MNEKRNAKEMFFYYSCSSFHMSKDGVLEDYKKLGISEEQEEAWRQQFIAHWLSQLSNDVFEATLKLQSTLAKEAIPELIDYAKNGDSFEKLWIADAIWTIVDANRIHISTNQSVREVAIQLWQDLVNDGVTIEKEHKHTFEDFTFTLYDVSTTEEYILKYANRKLAEAENPDLIFNDFDALLDWIDELSIKLSHMGEERFTKAFKGALTGATENEILDEVRRVLIEFYDSDASGKGGELLNIYYALQMLDDVLPARPE